MTFYSKLFSDESKSSETKTQAWIRRNARPLTPEERLECPWPVPDPKPEPERKGVDLLPFASYNHFNLKRAERFKSHEWTKGPKEGAWLAVLRHNIKSTK